MPVVELPEGAHTITPQGRYTGSAGDKARVTPRMAQAIERFRRTGPAHGMTVALGTKTGRRCESCRRVWNSWSTACPRCGTATVPA